MKLSTNKWFGLVKMLAPMILSTVNPRLAPIADKITYGIEEAEAIKGASGADKLKHVQNIALDAANSINAATGKETVDKASLNEAVQEGVDTVIAVLNVKKKSDVDGNK